MGEFREFRRAHGNNFNIKGQRLTGELMVTVEDRFLLVDVTDDEHAHAEIGFGVEAHPDLHFVRTEAIDGNALDQLVAVFTICIDGLHDDGLSVALLGVCVGLRNRGDSEREDGSEGVADHVRGAVRVR